MLGEKLKATLTKAMTIAGLVVIAGSLVALSACAGTSDAEKAALASARVLSGTEIQTTLAGNTLSGQTNSHDKWIEYYLPDGSIRGRWNGKDAYGGKWRVDGEKLCLDYDGAEYDGCYHLAQNTNQVFILDEAGGLHDHSVVWAAGNPNSL